jgi:2,4-dienoyl-CoA reductase-like NADH-dependent reductase (Old Yellow Enzyme family)
MLCGGLDGATAAALLDDQSGDLFAFGLPFIANPDLPRRLREGLPLGEPDTTLFYGGDDRGYTDYPAYSCRNPMLAHWSNRAR